ncbi:NADase-type glycan-binding domain-containing protein [Riemerella columbina]|uniref:NADase-type glycan-binding domain-containing protein n=1 Tax=Riemerella columbina TaxID=103810 RepID=UPI0004770BE0|nr:hypothetical protein [Riemerella columbina]
MKTLFNLMMILYSFNWAIGQNNKLPNYYPTKILKLDLSEKIAREIERQNQLLARENLNVEKQKELNQLLEKYGEVVESIWDIIEGGCSWYCGGGSYKVFVSSHLSTTNTIHYDAKSANDLSYKTAWVEGKKDEGIGEYLEYYFQNESPRITKIIITNGYVKTQKSWLENNRVKKLKLSVNGEVAGYLNLEDSRTNQVFEVGILGHNADSSDLVLKFEIVEVYKGKKYNDTAITEIYFDGIDVH